MTEFWKFSMWNFLKHSILEACVGWCRRRLFQPAHNSMSVKTFESVLKWVLSQFDTNWKSKNDLILVTIYGPQRGLLKSLQKRVSRSASNFHKLLLWFIELRSVGLKKSINVRRDPRTVRLFLINKYFLNLGITLVLQ